ncbi:hypothetical protein OGAPHI_004855 [Ogataea philodendri]|uniref:Peptide transporter PTR2 n=1 Tax=Ogataea philodendri TaxID=1378263 RepID=A0A9P8T2Y8_9ASCO|nr:uncharacterized protein OGAPHI_004855 [Ogataea philodendri]KAH3664141.1 hypothetical protein OGAPHI_004855 [Ogataea philodendri]
MVFEEESSKALLVNSGDLISPVSTHLDSNNIKHIHGSKQPEIITFQELEGSVDENSLRKVPGSIPPTAYLICLVELAERASYYGLSGCIANFIQRPLPAGSTTGAVPNPNSDESAGALGLGLGMATFLTQMLSFSAFLTPLYGGYVADTKYGKFKSVWIGVVIGFFAHMLLVVAALPFVIQTVWLSLLITAVSLIGIGFSSGFIKPNLFPLLVDQYTVEGNYIRELPSGESVLVDRDATLERMSLIYYFFINFGCFVAISSSLIERAFGFWLTYASTALVYCMLFPMLIYLRPRLQLGEPTGSSIFDEIFVLVKALFQAGWISRIKGGRFWDIDLSPSAKNLTPSISMEDFRSTMKSCVIFLYFIVFNLNDGSIASIQINQAGSMQTSGIPNDLFQSFNPLAILIVIPFQDYLIYPLLRKHRIVFQPVHRITLGFCISATGTLIGTYLQYRIYTISKCGWEGASNCDEVAPISAWWCACMFGLQAVGECFATVTAYELAYTMSSPAMKSFVVALFLCSNAISSVLGEIISFWAHDPNLFAIFLWCALLGFGFAALFLLQFRNLHKQIN